LPSGDLTTNKLKGIMMGRRDGSVGFVKFRTGGEEGLHDTGEGGVFCYLIVKAPGGWQESKTLERCCVETYAHLPRALCVGSSGHANGVSAEDDLWGPPPKFFWPIGSETPEDVCGRLHERHDRMNGPRLYAAIYLGSSSASVYNDLNERYVSYGYDDLTLDGKILYNSLKRMWGIEPIILTFLDT
jgi:hypothetical protein